jgi:predicted nucleic acid-binding protein
VHVATSRANDIPAIVSADRAFDGVPGLRRIDTLDTAAVGRLIER